MSKLKLEIENLQVESFDTSETPAARRGTVLGASGVEPAPESVDVCFSEMTGPCCDYTLVLSCIETQCDECTWGPVP